MKPDGESGDRKETALSSSLKKAETSRLCKKGQVSQAGIQDNTI